jgi:hypothetical protein
MTVARWQAVAPPPTVEPGRYFIWRVGEGP